MKLKSKNVVTTSLALAAVLIITGCGSRDQIDLGGVEIGMTRDQVATAAPSGATLYCRGDGDAQFEKTAQLPYSTNSTYCTWAAGPATNRGVAPVAIGETLSTEVVLVFSPDGRLASSAVATPANAYSAVVKSIKDKLGSPDSNQGSGSLTWTTKDGKLELRNPGFGIGEMTLLLLTPNRTQAGS